MNHARYFYFSRLTPNAPSTLHRHQPGHHDHRQNVGPSAVVALLSSAHYRAGCPIFATVSRSLRWASSKARPHSTAPPQPSGCPILRAPLRRVGYSRLREPPSRTQPHRQFTLRVVSQSKSSASPYPFTKTTTPFAGITTLALAASPCIGVHSASTPPAFPAHIGFTQLSYTSLLNTSTHRPALGNPTRYPHHVVSLKLATTTTSCPPPTTHR